MSYPENNPQITFPDLNIVVPENNLSNLDRIALNQYLGALFVARETLKLQWEEGSENLLAFDSVLSAALMIAVDRRGLSELMAEAQLLGWVANGADVLSLIEPSLRAYYETLRPENKDKLESIPIIGVVGKIASGKGTVAELLNDRYDVLSFPFSDRLRALALTMGFEPPYTRAQLREINDIYKPAFGNQIFVNWTMIQAARMAETLHVPELIVFDGFRSVKEAEFFLETSNTYLIAVVASLDTDEDKRIRFERQKDRRRGFRDTG